MRKLDQLMDDVSDVTDIGLTISEMRRERYRRSVELKTKKAELLFAQSKNTRAVDTLIEARHILRNDSTPDAEQEDLEVKIDERLSLYRA